MFKHEKNHTIDILFVITLFCVFAISVIALTGTGAKVYQNIVDDMGKNYNSRSAFTYIINKVHQYDASDAVKVGTYEGCDAIILSEEIDNITYCTYLYYYDGSLKELFTRSGQEFDPSYGDDIMELTEFKVTRISDTLYKFDVTAVNNESHSLFIHIKSESQEN